jgi:hypothetical protein
VDVGQKLEGVALIHQGDRGRARQAPRGAEPGEAAADQQRPRVL